MKKNFPLFVFSGTKLPAGKKYKFLIKDFPYFKEQHLVIFLDIDLRLIKIFVNYSLL